MLFSISLLLVTLFLPLAVKFGWVKGKIRVQLEEDNRKIRPLLTLSLLYILPLAVFIVLVNFIKNDLVMPCMTPGDLSELVRLPLPADFCFSHWWDILIIWVWSFVNLIFLKFYRRLKFEIFFIIASAAFGVYVAHYFSGALYGLSVNLLSISLLRLVDWLCCRFFGIEEKDCTWSPIWKKMRIRLRFVEKRFKWIIRSMGG